ADRLALQVEIWPLLRGRVRLPELRLDAPDVRLEANPGGGPGNWDFGFADDGDGDGDGDGEPLQLRRLWIEAGRLRFDDARVDTGIGIQLASREAGEGDAAPPVVLEGAGRWRGRELSLEGSAASPLEPQDADTPSRLA